MNADSNPEGMIKHNGRFFYAHVLQHFGLRENFCDVSVQRPDPIHINVICTLMIQIDYRAVHINNNRTRQMAECQFIIKLFQWQLLLFHVTPFEFGLFSDIVQSVR